MGGAGSRGVVVGLLRCRDSGIGVRKRMEGEVGWDLNIRNVQTLQTHPPRSQLVLTVIDELNP